MHRPRRPTRNTVVAFAAVAVLALGAAIVSVAGGHDVERPSPQDTVRDFLVTSVVDGDGVDACGYLTPGAVRSLSRVEPRDITCHDALSDTQLVLGGERVDSEAEVKDLHARVTRHGGRAEVALTAHGATMTFALRQATAAESKEADAPPTRWRIDSSIARLAPR